MKDFKRVMIELAQDMHFEEAQNQREKRSPRELSIAFDDSKSKITNIDVFSIVSDESAAYQFFTNSSWFDYSFAYYGN
jgi:excinuclease ABC subunit C